MVFHKKHPLFFHNSVEQQYNYPTSHKLMTIQLSYKKRKEHHFYEILSIFTASDKT